MHDTQLYQTILGLQAPWRIVRVELDQEEERVNLWAEHTPNERWPCPTCQRRLPCRDHTPEREWRHLDTCQYRTILHARVPRVECPDHGVQQVRIPWAEPWSRFTALMERFLIDLTHQCGTVAGATAIARVSWDEAWGVMDRATKRGLARKRQRQMPYLGVDEKAFRKGHRYHTLVCDLEQATVEFVARERRTESLTAFYAQLTPRQRGAVKAVAMDMWDPYIQATAEGLPNGADKIVHDRFHILKMMTEAVDRVRRAEHRAFVATGEPSPLVGTKYLWLYGAENLPARDREAFTRLQRLKLKVGRAWALKEALRELWHYRSPAAIRRYLRWWLGWASRSRLAPVIAVAQTIRRHADAILRFAEHPITTGVVEGLNSKIMTIKRKACGFKNPDHFTTAIYFHCGGLDLYPH
jgi:transposase